MKSSASESVYLERLSRETRLWSEFGTALVQTLSFLRAKLTITKSVFVRTLSLFITFWERWDQYVGLNRNEWHLKILRNDIIHRRGMCMMGSFIVCITVVIMLLHYKANVNWLMTFALSIEWFWFLFRSILNGVTLKTSNTYKHLRILNIHIQNMFLRKLNLIMPLNYSSKSVYYILGTVGSI